MSESLTRDERLRRRTEIRRVFEHGRNFSCRGLRLRIMENTLPYNRVLVAPVKKAGHSVDRNRLRRVGKEAYRRLKPRLRGGFDLAFVVYPGDYSFSERLEQFQHLLRDARLLNDE
ncbi:MAG: ribonuclease P protein component [Spirochaetes bacterium]|jgi:ribonuclease P protein component|nr:ribonuclease P protein component [Spirochaetota bacterium]